MSIFIVFPILWGDVSLKTIHLINDGSLVLKEVLILISKNWHLVREVLSEFHKITIIVIEFKGQVLQLIEGFK